MESRRFLLEGPTLPALQARVVAEYGANAIIVAAERVTVGGIRGFFARQHFEITVEVTAPAKRTRSAHAGLDISARLGIAALLDDADEAEAQLYAIPATPRLSTDSEGFAQLMDELTFATGRTAGSTARYESATPRPGGPTLATPPPALARPPVPTPLTRAGDLVLMVGLEHDPLTIARLMLRVAGAGALRVAGAAQPDRIERIDDRRSALLARAHGVEIGHSIFIAYGLEPDGEEHHGAQRECVGDLVVADVGPVPHVDPANDYRHCVRQQAKCSHNGRLVSQCLFDEDNAEDEHYGGNHVCG